ncbi:MAG: hypothetical protein AB1509_14515 [Chloroflexota bacterium]
MKDLLNPYQKNSLRMTLQMFEENLRRALEWLDGREENGFLYTRKLNLPDEKKAQALGEIHTALGLIENLVHKFDLPKDASDAASLLRGELSVNWANLLDTRARKLNRYGKTHRDLSGMLDSDIQKLAEIALGLSSILGETRQEKS